MLNKLTITFFTSIFSLVANIISGIITARLLGPAGKGELTAIILWPNFLAAIGNFGITESIIYYSGKEEKNKISIILTNGVVSAIIQAIPFMIIGFIVMPYLMNSYSQHTITWARIFLIFIPINLLTLNQHGIVQGLLKIHAYNFGRIIVSWGYTIGLILIYVFNQVSVNCCVISLLISNILTLIYLILYSMKQGWLKWDINWSILQKMYGFGIKAHIGNISSMLNLRLDQMVMAIWLPPKLLGFYVVAVTFSGGLNLISSAIATIGFPSISMSTQFNDQRDKIPRYFRLNFWTCCLGALVMIFITPWILPVLFGEAYESSVPVAQILIVAAFFSGSNRVLAASIKGLGRPIISTYGEVISLGITIILLYFLLPRFLIMGAAVASLIAYSISFLYLCYFLLHNQQLSLKKMIVPQIEDVNLIKNLVNQRFYFSKRFIN